ncbi:MAG: type II toxin-antitoxin system RelB/DinJ family antitoxin [Sedimentisphaerales bacterium]|nr:type II toxin-antitoxin system RelB/DinJ family antitoxin [Sedimentisphaerales bacterium]
MTTQVTARIDAESKKEVQEVLNRLGLSMSEAISIYFKQIILRRGIPFIIEIPPETPNELTAKVLADSKQGRGLQEAANVDELFKELNS